ncbi:MAG TPA: peptidylprolyl isomerase [Blastocatellia bacterium]|nr:peptidylprolyl isomerase [Blastocatellia bacterium]
MYPGGREQSLMSCVGRIFVTALLVVVVLAQTAGAQQKKRDVQTTAQPQPVESDPSAVEAVINTELGVVRFEFFPDKAPLHVQQFLKLARSGFYDGSGFHRVYAHSLVQGGDPLLKDPSTPRERWGTGGLNQLPDEISGLKHVRGTVSTVRIPGKPGSDGAQFFICLAPQPQLDAEFSAFGQVNEGLDVVDRISQAPVDAQSLTEKPIKIVSIKIEPKKTEPFKDATLEQLRRDVLLRTSLGDITVTMDPSVAPEHVRNFLKLVQTGYYDHTAFHRIVPGFVVQGGLGSTRAGGASHPAERWVRRLKPEFSKQNHLRGVLSMARGDELDSASTSFFIMLAASPHLDGKYTIFGRVIDGLEVLDLMEKAPRHGETPVERIELIEATIKY